MDSDSSDLGRQRRQTRLILGVVAVVCSSLALTVGIFYWHFLQELAAGNVPKEARYYEGSLKDGELWYRVTRFSGNPLAPTTTTRLKRLNLETGEQRETEFEFREPYVLPVWIGETLYVYTYNAIYQVDGAPSALAPENSPHDVTGWEPILSDRVDDDWVQMVCDRDGLLFARTNKPFRFLRQHADGRREELNGDTVVGADEQYPWIAADPSADISYVVMSNNPFWGSATIRRIEGQTLRRPHLVVPGYEQAYIARWKWNGLRLLTVWLIPMAVLLWGANSLTHHSTRVSFNSFGQQGTLASLSPRLTFPRSTALLSDRIDSKINPRGRLRGERRNGKSFDGVSSVFRSAVLR